MIPDYQNEWIVRSQTTGRVTTLAHYCESMIADRYVTTCGLEMHRSNHDGIITGAQDERQCFTCGHNRGGGIVDQRRGQ
jgi:hypothetical protein